MSIFMVLYLMEIKHLISVIPKHFPKIEKAFFYVFPINMLFFTKLYSPLSHYGIFKKHKKFYSFAKSFNVHICALTTTVYRFSK